MLIKTQSDVILFLKIINNEQLDNIKIRQWHNNCFDIEKLPINILRNIKQKYNEFKKLLKDLRQQELILNIKMNFESGMETFESEKTINDINNYNNNLIYNLSIREEPNKCIDVLFQYTDKINKLYKNIININHILSICESIIFNLWKHYYSCKLSKE